MFKKWLSNSPAVLKDIPPEECATPVNLDSGQLPSTKTLGVMWHPEADMFTFSSKQPDFPQSSTRYFLRSTVSLFNTLGFLIPFYCERQDNSLADMEFKLNEQNNVLGPNRFSSWPAQVTHFVDNCRNPPELYVQKEHVFTGKN